MPEEIDRKELYMNTVVKANEMIQKYHFDLTVQQQRIILYLISQIKPHDEEFKMYDFDINEFCKVCGIYHEYGKNYVDVKNCIDEIAQKRMWKTLEDGKQTIIRWIEKPYIDEKNGRLQIIFDKDMKPFLLQLNRDFTQYDLLWVLCFRSKYSIRLYELIKSIHYRELTPYQRIFSVDELKSLIDAEEYSAFSDFRKRVLLPAITEINALSDKTLEVEYIKSGRSVTGIHMTISSKSTAERMKLMSEIGERGIKRRPL